MAFDLSAQIIPYFRPKCSKSIPYFRPKRLKTIVPFGAAHTYIAHIRKCPPPPPLGIKLSRLLKESPLALNSCNLISSPRVRHFSYLDSTLSACELRFLLRFAFFFFSRFETGISFTMQNVFENSFLWN